MSLGTVSSMGRVIVDPLPRISALSFSRRCLHCRCDAPDPGTLAIGYSPTNFGTLRLPLTPVGPPRPIICEGQVVTMLGRRQFPSR